MDGRILEGLAQRNKNWSRGGFNQSREIKPINSQDKPTNKPVYVQSTNSNTPGITAINIDGKFYSISDKFDKHDFKARLNYELLEFLFLKYSQYGLLSISDLVDFINKNNLKKYLITLQ